MNKLSKVIISLILAVLTAFSVITFPSSAAAEKISKTSLIIAKGYTDTIRVTGASKVKWSSDNEAVASVTQKGKITGKKIGTATISADTGKTVLKCKVSVRAGKITANASKLSIAKGSSADVSVKAVGTTDLLVSSTDNSIAKASFTKKESGGLSNLRISAVNDGEARIKIYSKKYPKSVYKYIDVKAGKGKPVGTATGSGVTASVDSIEVNENLSASFTVKSSDIALTDLRIISTNKHSFDVEASIDTVNGYISVKVNGYVEDKGNIRIISDKNQNLQIIIPVTVTNNTYDVVVSNREPHKRANTDIIYYSVNPEGKKFYVLEPKDCDTAHAASLLAKAADFFEYDTIYESVPKKQDESDTVLVKSLNYKGERVLRYILAKKGFDPALTSSMFAVYCGEFDYNVVYAVYPTTKKRTDKVITYEYIPLGKTKSEKRYIISSTGEQNEDTDKAWEEYVKIRGNVTVL